MNSLKDRINLNHTIYVLSHDFLNDIISLKGLISLIKNKHLQTLNKDDLENFTLIEDTINNYEQTINRLLEYSRISTRGAPSELTNLKKIINVSLKKFNNKKLKIIWKKHINCKIKVDVNQLIYAFSCLLDNCIKFCDNPDPEITICEDTTTSSEWYIITLKDNGKGIPDELEENLFMMFRPGKHINSGLGLGLAYVQKIIERHEGEVKYNFEEKKLEISLPKYICFIGDKND